MTKRTHHYTESGLLNVYIEGVDVLVDADGDETVTIERINELHRVIALGIVAHEKGMSGDELRFLRSEMGMTQAELSSVVHRDKQTIGRWERSEIEIESAAEAVIRRLAIEKLELPTDSGIDELSRKSVPTAMSQQITIAANDVGSYELLRA